MGFVKGNACVCGSVCMCYVGGGVGSVVLYVACVLHVLCVGGCVCMYTCVLCVRLKYYMGGMDGASVFMFVMWVM